MRYGRTSAVAAAVVAAGVGWVWWSRAPAQVQVTVQAPTHAPTPVPAKPVAGLPALPVEVRVAGAHVLHYAMTADTGEADARVELTVDGVLEAAPPTHVDGAVWQALRLRDVKVVQNAMAAALAGGLPETALEQPWLVRHEADGRVAELRFDPATPTPVRGLLGSVAMASQFAQPESAQAAWTARETHLNGDFAVRYARQDDGSVVKERRSEPGRWPSLTETTRYQFRDGQLASLSANEQGTYPLTDPTHAHRQHTYSIAMTLQPQAAAVAWQPTVAPQGMERWSQAERIGATQQPARPPEQVLQALAELKGPVSTTDEVKLRDELSAGLRRDATAIAPTVEKLRLHGLHDDGERIAVAGLVGARTDAALSATAALIADRKVLSTVRGQLMQAATQLETPHQQLMTVLRGIAETSPLSALGGLAANALGAQVAACVHFGDVDFAKMQLAALLVKAAPIVAPATFGDGTSHEAPLQTRVAWISSLGNSRHPTALPILAAALREHEELVRAHAAFALRHQNPLACLELMTEVMAKEPSPLVRGWLIDAARHMGPGTVGALVTKALRFDKSESVRLAAVYALGVWSAKSPGVRKDLQAALETETSMTVAEAIKEHLKPGQAQATAVKTVLDPDHIDPATLGVLP